MPASTEYEYLTATLSVSYFHAASGSPLHTRYIRLTGSSVWVFERLACPLPEKGVKMLRLIWDNTSLHDCWWVTQESTLQDQMTWQHWAISQAGTVWASSRATVRKADRENERRGNDGPDPTRSLEEKKSHWLIIKKWLYCRPSFGAWILAVPLCLVAIVYKYVPVPMRQTIRHWSSSIMALKVSKNSQNSWYACFDPVSLILQWKL